MINAHLHDVAVAMLAFLGVTAAVSILPLAALGSTIRSRTAAYRVASYFDDADPHRTLAPRA